MILLNIPKNIGKTEMRAAIDEWIIGENGERDRAILTRKLIDGIHFEELAEEFSLSVRHTKKIVRDRWQTLRQHFAP